MDAAAVNLQTFFSATEKFIIPAYQRRYSWGERQCKELFDDILHLKENREHLLGMIIYQTQTRASTLHENEIVDGQQRTTTISLLFRAIQNRLEEIDNERFAHIINQIQTFLYTYVNGRAIKIQLGNMDNSDFQAIINNPKNNLLELQNPKIKEAYQYFLARITKLPEERITSFYYDLISNATIIRIKIDTARNAYKLFEATNNRGMPLSDTDKIKNFLLGRVADIADSQNNSDLLSEAINIWTQIIRNIEDLPKEDDFLRHYLISKTRTVISYKKITDAFENYYKLQEDQENNTQFQFTHQRILNDIQILSKIYKNINDSSFSPIQGFINPLSDNLKAIKCTPAYSFMMNLYNPENQLSEGTITIVSKIIEAFMLRLHICKIQTGKTDSIFADLINSFDYKNNPMEFINSIKVRLSADTPNDITFHNAFKRYDFNASLIGRARYILKSLFGIDQGPYQELQIGDTNLVHVEHILPLNPDQNDDWENQLGENYQNLYPNYIHKIGNLTLLSAALNISISNSVYSRKRESLDSSNIPATKLIAQQYYNFDFESIDQRSALIADRALQIWPFIEP